MNSIRSFVFALPPVKALRVEKWRRRVLTGLFSKADVASGEAYPERKRQLIETRKNHDRAAEELARQLAASECSAQKAEDMLWWRFAYGFSFQEYRCYDFEKKTREERLAFFSDRESVLLSYDLNDLDAMSLFSDKWRTYCRFHPLYKRDAVCLSSADDFDTFLRFLAKHPVAIAKPTFGSCGKGVQKIDAVSGGPYSRELFLELLNDGKTVLEELISQSPALAVFHSSSVNTVRVVTFRGKNGVRTLWAFLKTGRNGSLTDNGASGGIMAGIDPDDGRIITEGIDETGCRYHTHPDTGISFAGHLLPEWESLQSMCVSAASCVPEVRMIGWDAAHTINGWCIVEGNAQSELIGPQAVFGCGLRRKLMNMLEELHLPTDAYRA